MKRLGVIKEYYSLYENTHTIFSCGNLLLVIYIILYYKSIGYIYKWNVDDAEQGDI